MVSLLLFDCFNVFKQPTPSRNSFQTRNSAVSDEAGWDERNESNTNIGLRAVRQQEFVNLNVGGKHFKISRCTLMRYPNSLLYKLMREFPQIVDNGEPLVIERDAKNFECVLEIYRGGMITSPKEDLTVGDLQKELDFYQLPTNNIIALIGIPTQRSYADELVDKIVTEIHKQKLMKMFPWRAYIYHKTRWGVVEKEPRIYLGTQGVCPREHRTFKDAIEFSEDNLRSRTTFGVHIEAIKKYKNITISKRSFFVRTLQEFRKNSVALNEAARKYGLSITTPGFCTECLAPEYLTVSVL